MDRPIALVTGASRGIGRAIAIQLASDGFFVIINYYQNNVAAEEVLNLVKDRGDDGLVQKFDASAYQSGFEDPGGQKRGHRIVNIASVIGEMGFAHSTNYSASKAGVIGFTKALAGELSQKNITVNAIAPGFIATDMTSSLPLDQYLTQVPLGRIGQLEKEIAIR